MLFQNFKSLYKETDFSHFTLDKINDILILNNSDSHIETCPIIQNKPKWYEINFINQIIYSNYHRSVWFNISYVGIKNWALIIRKLEMA
jgi:hypothetical protein